ncbi:MAG: hypothetical protein RLZZ338_3101, partial [Cyanobacteriota bacterium]
GGGAPGAGGRGGGGAGGRGVCVIMHYLSFRDIDEIGIFRIWQYGEGTIERVLFHFSRKK